MRSQELQSDSPDCLSFEAMHSCQSLWLISQVKIKPRNPHNITLCVFFFFQFIFSFLFPSFGLAYSQPSPQTACNHLRGSHFGSKLTWSNLRLAQATAFQSISQEWLENSHFFPFPLAHSTPE